jgi:hypothetical protein
MAKRGRPSKKPAATSDGEPRPNGEKTAEQMTDEQLSVLFFQHKRAYDNALSTKKAADAGLKNVCKLAKAELGDDAVASIKDALLLETDEGQAKMEAAIARQARIARWMAVPLGAQPDFFNTDMAPATDRAFDAGKAARLQGAALKPPHDPSVPQHDSWISGWHAGEKALNDAQRRDGEMAFGEADKALTGPFDEGEDDLAELVEAAEAE